MHKVEFGAQTSPEDKEAVQSLLLAKGIRLGHERELKVREDHPLHDLNGRKIRVSGIDKWSGELRCDLIDPNTADLDERRIMVNVKDLVDPDVPAAETSRSIGKAYMVKEGPYSGGLAQIVAVDDSGNMMRANVRLLGRIFQSKFIHADELGEEIADAERIKSAFEKE